MAPRPRPGMRERHRRRAVRGAAGPHLRRRRSAPASTGSSARYPAAVHWPAPWPRPETLRDSLDCGEPAMRTTHLSHWSGAAHPASQPRSCWPPRRRHRARSPSATSCELLDAEAGEHHRRPMPHAVAFYRTLHRMGVLGPDAPATLQQAAHRRAAHPEQLIDRYQLTCRPVRDLLVDYLRERQPALDYTSLRSLALPSAACSGPIWNATIPASTACTCRRGRHERGNSGCGRDQDDAPAAAGSNQRRHRGRGSTTASA